MGSLQQTKINYGCHQRSSYWSNEFYLGCLQEQKRLTDSWITKAHPRMGDISKKVGKLEHTVQPTGSLQAAQEVESMFSRDRPNPPQSNLIVFCLSQSDGLVAASSLQLGLFIFWKKGSNDFVQFQRLLEALLGCLPSNLRTMPSVWACFYLGET